MIGFRKLNGLPLGVLARPAQPQVGGRRWVLCPAQRRVQGGPPAATP